MTTVDRAKVLELYREYGSDAPAHFPASWGDLTLDLLPSPVRKHGDGSHDESSHGNWARGASVAGSVPISPSERIVRRATDALGQRVELFAEANGMSVEEVKAQLDENTQEYLSDKRPCIRVPLEVLDDVLNEGFKNQFQSFSSRGTYSHNLRAQAEENLFGLEMETPGSERPIYGYVGDLMGNDGQVMQYGDVRVILHASVSERTSITPNDSLAIGSDEYYSTIGVPEMWEEAGWRQSAPFIPAWFPGVPVVNESGNVELERADLSRVSPGLADRYVEAQIHGGVGADHIDEVIFDNVIGDIPMWLTDRLDELGITWSVMPF